MPSTGPTPSLPGTRADSARPSRSQPRRSDSRSKRCASSAGSSGQPDESMTSAKPSVFVLRGFEPGLYRVAGTFFTAGDNQFRRFSQPLEVRPAASDLDVTFWVE